MPVVVASAGGSGGAGRASSRRSSRPGARRARPRRAESVFEPLLRATSAWGAGLTATAGITLLVRRLSGDVAAPHGAAALLAATVIGIGVVGFVDAIRPRGLAVRFAARLGLALASVALLPPLSDGTVAAGSRLVAIVALIAASIVLLLPLRESTARPRALSARPHRAAEAAPRHGRRSRRRAASPPPRDAGDGAAWSSADEAAAAAVTPAPGPPSIPVPTRAATPVTPPPVEPGSLLLQRFERVLEPGDRTETVRGTILLRVAAGSRSAIGHVGFCPPFPHFPRVEVGTSCEEVEATVVAAEVLPWGVRVECRLDEAADESIDVPVDVVARSPNPADMSESVSP